ncbi:DUF2218 domain-containing protein [Dankookia rubra]|uniref:DUF2218 domain-containing protein n=1 Tax=Dankookia rubra TaxID=1442381 RepID=A0A4R5QK50_9PROT|nr:DUF2218 domain-containing protein [Dankookia rubra]TDH63199.1 DUF2218 domain-containing protein [Dankookia rubra]
MPASVARVAMEQPRRYLGQLCRHFAHRLPVTLAETSGSIAFPAGTCALAAEGDVLALRIEAADPAALPGLEDVVARHLLRFAFRDPPEVSWAREAG